MENVRATKDKSSEKRYTICANVGVDRRYAFIYIINCKININILYIILLYAYMYDASTVLYLVIYIIKKCIIIIMHIVYNSWELGKLLVKF